MKNIENDDIDRYNTAIVELMKSEGVIINDLNKCTRNQVSYYAEDNLHLNEKGIKACGDQVSGIIKKYL